jgi:hypothetical protein
MENINNLPEIYFSNYDLWIKEKNKLYDNIKKSVNIIINDKKEFCYIDCFSIGLTIDHIHDLYYVIFKHLSELSKEDKWSNIITNFIITGLTSFTTALNKTKYWKQITNSGSKKVSNIINDYIIEYLENYTKEIPKTDCYKCGIKIHLYCEISLCDECDNNSTD